MSLKFRLLLFLTLLFLFFSLGVWIYSETMTKHINEQWAEKFVRNQVLFDKSRTLLPILHELSLIKKMVKDPALTQMAIDEKNATALSKGLSVLENYRLKFKDRSYFVGLVRSGHYYFNDYKNTYAGKQYQYTLSKEHKDDKWFFNALKLKDNYQINVNKDTMLGTTKVWINYLLRYKGDIVAVIGTGLDLEPFLKESVDFSQDGIENIFVNENLAIQLEKDTSFIDYASFTKGIHQHQTLNLILKNPKEFERVKQAVTKLNHSKNKKQVITFWCKIEGQSKLLAITYLPEFNWYSVSIIDSSKLSLLNNLNIFLFMIILFLLALIGLIFVNNALFITPLAKLRLLMKEIQHGSKEIEIPIIGSGEIAELSKQFKQMLEVINQNSIKLEHTVNERTAEIKESEEKLHTILDNVEAYIYIKDTEFCYTYVNKHVEKLFKKKRSEIIGKKDEEFFDKKTAHELRAYDQEVFQKKKKTEKEEVSTNKDGSIHMAFLSTKVPLYKEDGTVYALCGISTDITQRKQIEDEIKQMAYYDTLTHLPNRRLLNEHLELAIESSKRTQRFAATMFLDLDNFKPLNDTYGHEVGDILLIEVAYRLKSCVREIDTVARFGGDEFVVLLSALSNDEEKSMKITQQIADKIKTAIARPYTLHIDNNTIEHSITVSIGAILFKHKDKTQDQILKLADKAMYEAKAKGKNQINYFVLGGNM